MSAAFELERFAVADGRLELAGCWRADPQRRYRRVRLLVETGAHIRRLAPVDPAPVHATPSGEPWVVRFRWAGDPERITRAELEVGRDLAVALPRPGHAPGPGEAAPPEPVGPSALAYRAEILEIDARLEAAREEARQRTEEAEAARSELDGVRSEATRARAEARAAREEIESLREELAAAGAELSTAGEALETAGKDREALRDELKRLRAQATERPAGAAAPVGASSPDPARPGAPAHGQRVVHPHHHHQLATHLPPPRRRPRPHDVLTLRVATIALAVPVVVALVVIVESLS